MNKPNLKRAPMEPAHDAMINGYMAQVRDYLASGGQIPLGYDENDRDMGYRSALRFHGIEQSVETDSVANKNIYGDL